MKWFVVGGLLVYNAFAGFSELPQDSRYQHKKKSLKKKKLRKVIKRSSISDHTKKLLEKDQKILELLERSQKRLIVRKKEDKIMALTRMKGVLLNSVLAMNVKPSKFIVRINDSSLDLHGGELRCLGYSFEKRVPSKCDLLVFSDQEFKVDIDVWDLDGAEGIIADYYYSGEEKSFLTSSFASFLGATFDVAKGGVSSPFGSFNQNTAKNKIFDGLSSVAGNTQQSLIKSGEKNLTISYVNSGKEVLIFFNKSLRLGEQN
jgi:hypothetical protein